MIVTEEAEVSFEELYGVTTPSNKPSNVVPLHGENINTANYLSTFRSCLFLGSIGLHHIYAGKILKGICTPLSLFGFMGIWPTINLYQIANGTFTDNLGKPIRHAIQVPKEEISDLDFKTAFLFSMFLSWSGLNHYYAGKPFEGVINFTCFAALLATPLWPVSLITASLFTTFDLYRLGTYTYKDGEGKLICPNYIKERAYTATSI